MLSNNLPYGFVAKIDRAKEHLNILRSSIESFTDEGNSYSIVKESNPETGEYLFRFIVQIEPPIIQWSLLVGDCLHNARSALDHLFWALLVKNNPAGIPKESSRATFPILRDCTTFNGRKKELENWVGKEVLLMFEKIQPFNDIKGANFNSLMFLHDFDIADKHKLLLPAINVLEKGELQTNTVDNKNVLVDGMVYISLMGLEHNSLLAEFKYRTPQDVLDANFRTSLGVVFKGQPGPMKIIPTLERVIEVVEGVVNNFIPFLSNDSD